MATKNRIVINEEDIGQLVTLKLDLRNVESLLQSAAMPGHLSPAGASPLPVSADLMTLLLSTYRDKLKEDIAALISAP